MAATKTIVRYRSKPKVHHRRAGMTVPMAVVAGFVPLTVDVLSAFKAGGSEAALGHVSLGLTGYNPADGKWSPMWAVQKFYAPAALGLVAHKLAGRLGINRMLSRAGIPLLRI